MNTLLTVIVVIQVVAALSIIGLVLLQHGKGADMGAAFGSGSSGSLFGASGSSNFLSKSTGIAAAIFFSATLALAFFGNRPAGEDLGVMERLSAPAATNAPVSEVPGAAPATEQQPAEPAGTSSPAEGAGQAGQIPK